MSLARRVFLRMAAGALAAGMLRTDLLGRAPAMAPLGAMEEPMRMVRVVAMGGVSADSLEYGVGGSRGPHIRPFLSTVDVPVGGRPVSAGPARPVGSVDAMADGEPGVRLRQAAVYVRENGRAKVLVKEWVQGEPEPPWPEDMLDNPTHGSQP